MYFENRVTALLGEAFLTPEVIEHHLEMLVDVGREKRNGTPIHTRGSSEPLALPQWINSRR
jgi:hypothetical protein